MFRLRIAPMRWFPFFLIGLALITVSAQSQTIVTKSTPSVPPIPRYRPVLLGQGPTSLIDQIDVPSLMAKGQKDAAVMFVCVVDKMGKTVGSETYRGTPDSKALEQELQNRLTTAKFAPAIYDYKPVDAVYYGTVVFAVVRGKPRLRIFSNQETEDLKKESDFISPQPFFGSGSGFLGTHYPKGLPVETTGIVELVMTIDATGGLKQIEVKSEEPPFLGFGDAALEDFKTAKFIPAFRNGKAVESKVTLPVHYIPKPWGVPE